MPESMTKPMPIPRVADSRTWSASTAEQGHKSRMGRPSRPESLLQQEALSGARKLRSRVNEDVELGMAELQRIMQGSNQTGQPANNCFYGMSPPTRTTGAANPMGMDSAWRSTAYKATHSNLQALREMSAPSFVRNNMSAAILCIPESPDCGFLSAEFEVFDSEEEERRASPESCQTSY